VAQPWPDPWWSEDLPAYLIEPAAPRETGEIGFHRLAHSLSNLPGQSPVGARSTSAPVVPFGGQSPRVSPVFERTVDLHRGSLPATLDAWWSTRAKAGAVVVQHRLRLLQPERLGAAGWKIRGRVRRLTALHWIAVQIELWPVHEGLTRLTMSPEGHVLASPRYFRLGHYALDRLSEDLAGISHAAGATTSCWLVRRVTGSSCGGIQKLPPPAEPGKDRACVTGPQIWRRPTASSSGLRSTRRKKTRPSRMPKISGSGCSRMWIERWGRFTR
jgi:hypothetical protein